MFGTIEIIEDLVESGKSVLIMGRPGVGKTTMLREAARVLADELDKRVVIVDTSNEIAGDGDIPHPAIGRARRMQVRTPAQQHAVMIEAVENHMPEVIVIDEIGTELEARRRARSPSAACSSSEPPTATTLENLMLNPTLSDLDRRHPDASRSATRRHAAAAPRRACWSARRRQRSTSSSRSSRGTG